MSSLPVNVAVIDKNTIVKTEVLRTEKSGSVVRIKAIAGGKYLLAEGDKGVAPENITIKRVGKNLHIALEGTDPDQPQLIIEGFFDHPGELIGVAEDGLYYPYITSDAEQSHLAPFLIDGESSAQVLGSQQLVGLGALVPAAGIGALPFLLGLAALGLIGGGIAIAAHNRGGHHNDDNNPAAGPNAPTLGSITDNVGDKQGPISNGGVTDDSTPTLSGTGTPGNTVIIKDNGKVIGEATVGADGTWTFTPSTPLADGQHTIVLVERDPAGNESQPSAGFDFTVDLVAPGKAVISEILDDAGNQQGPIAQDGITDDNTPTLKGTAEPGSTVEVYANGVKLGETTTNADGTWSFTPAQPLADGPYSFTVVAVDAAGNRGLPSDPFLINVDSTGNLISITQVIDDVGPITGNLANGAATDDTTPTLNGRASPNSTVNVYDNGALIGSTTSDANGYWTFTPTTPLPEGPHSFTATVVPATGIESSPTSPFDVVVDTTPPGKPGSDGNPGIGGVQDDVGPNQGNISKGGITDDNTPTFTGSGQEPGGTVIIKDNGQIIGVVPVDENGNWTFTPETPLADGNHDITLIVTDPAGNQSEESDPYPIIVDTTPPAAAEGLQLTDNVGAVTGPISNGDTTDDNTPAYTGTAEPGTTVIIKDNGVEIGRVPVDANGNWTFTPATPLEDGPHSYTNIVQDKAGNQSPESPPLNFTVDTSAVVISIDKAVDDVGPITGNIARDGVTDDTTPTIVGKAVPNSPVNVYDNGTLIGSTTSDANGNWSFTPTTPLPEGPHSFTAAVVENGVESPQTVPFNLSIDTTPPGKPSLGDVFDNVGPVQGNVPDGGTTDDNTPTLSGSGQEPGGTVIIKDNGQIIGVAPVDENGNWTFTPDTPLADGNHDITLIATDPAGNQSEESDPYTIIVDTSQLPTTVAPATGLTLIDDVGPQTGPINNGDTTDDNTPTFGGKAQPGTTVIVKDNGQVIGTAPVDENGNWTFTPSTPLADGPHSFTSIVQDASGNQSTETTPINFTIDTSAVEISITNVVDDVGPITGNITPGGVTDDTTPTIVGKATPNSPVNVYDNGTLIGSTTSDANGNWSFTPGTPLPEGLHSFNASVVDNGVESPQTAPFNLSIDTTPPRTPGENGNPGIGDVQDNVGPIQGSVPKGGTTDDNTPTIGGSGQQPGDTVIIKDNGQIIGTAPVDQNGNWTFTPDTPLADGNHDISLVVTDPAGNASQESKPYPIIVDTTPPAAAAGSQLIDNVGDITGPISNGDTTDDNTPTYSGTAEPNTTLIIKDNGVEIGRVPVDANGNWTFTPGTPLADGPHSYTNIVQDKAGNQSPESAPLDFIVDTTAVTISIDNVVDDVGPITGNVARGGVTDDTEPTINGKATPDSQVNVYDRGVLLGTTNSDANGNWTFTPTTPLAEGTHSITATVVTAADGESKPTVPFNLSIDTTPPGKPGADGNPGIGDVQDNVGAIQGTIPNGGTTDDNTPTLSGTGQEPGGTVIIKDNGQIIGTAPVDQDGNWTFTPSPVLEDGKHDITLIATDPAGNQSPESDPYTIIVDTTPPAAAGGLQLLDDVGPIQGPITNGTTTDDNTPTLNGTAEPGSTVIVKDNGVEIGRAPVDANGNWTFTPTTPLLDGPHSYTTIVQDAAGNQSPATDPLNFIVDTRAVTISITNVVDDVGPITGNVTPGGSTDDTEPTVVGKATPNATVNVYDKGALLGTTTSDANGNWSFTPTTPLPEGAHSFTATVVLPAEGESAPTAPFNLSIDTTAPGKPGADGNPGIGDVQDNVGVIQGTVPNGGTTDDNTPTISGSGQEPGGTVIVKDNGQIIGTAPVDANGNWTLTPSPALADGQHDITLIAADPAGNQSPESDPYTIIVDTSAPAAASGSQLIDDFGKVTGPINNGDTTDDNTPTFSGKAEPNTTLIVKDKGVEIGRVPVDADGNWTFTPTTPLADGPHSYTSIVQDKAGNQSPETTPLNFIIDTTLPPISITTVVDNVGPITGNVANGGVTDDTQPAISGKTSPNLPVNIYDGGTLIGSTTADGNGNWTFTPTTPLPEGGHYFTATAVSPVSGETDPTSSYNVSVDTTPPGKPGADGNGGIDDVQDNVGIIQGTVPNGGSTDDNTPVLSGGDQEPGGTVIIKDNGQVIATVPVDQNGNWTYTPPAALPDGEHDFTIIATDPAGNASPESDPYKVIVDTVPPAKPVITQVLDDFGNQTGPVAQGGITDDTQPQISGTAEPNSTIVVYDNGKVIGTAPVDANGNWTLQPTSPLTSGSHQLTAKAADAAANLSDASDPFNFTVVLAGTAQAPAITGVDDNVGPYQGNISPGGVTDDTTPAIHGTGAPGSTISVYSNGTLLGTAPIDGNGNWTYTPTTPLAQGLNNLTAKSTDSLGNISVETGKYPITVDSVAPAAATNPILTDDVGPVQGQIANNSVTDDNTPTYSGKAPAGTTVIVKDNGVEIGRAPVDSAGNWTFTPTTPLADGAHSFTGTVEDKAGNQSPATTPIAFTINTAVPVTTIDYVVDDVGPITGNIAKGGATDDTTPTLHGKSTPLSTVNVYDGTGANPTLLGTAPVDANGNWSFTPTTPLTPGAHSFSAAEALPLGLEGPKTAQFPLTIDTTAPAKPSITDVQDDVGTIQGTVTNGGSTDDTTPTVRGKGTAGDTIIVKDNGTVIGQTVVDSTGNWTFTPYPPLPDGTHAFTIIERDPVGNASPESDPYSVIVDTVPPAANAVVTSMTKDSGANTTDFVTNDGSAGRLVQGTLTAPLAAGEVIQVSVDGGKTWKNGVADGDGTWSFNDQTKHTTGWDIQTRVVDLAGNVGQPSVKHVTLDQTVTTPNTITWDLNTITVGFNKVGVVAGDAVYVIIDNHYIQQTLTQADIDAAKVSVPWSAAANGNPTTMQAALTDQVGNVSDYVYMGKTSSAIFTETFNNQTVRGFGTGQVFTLHDTKLTIVQQGTYGGYFGRFGNGQPGVTNPPSSMAIEMAGGAGTRYDIQKTNPTAANAVSFTVGDLTGGEVLQVNLYNAAGSLLSSQNYSANGTGVRPITLFAPNGQNIDKISFTMTTSVQYNYLWIDNVSFGKQVYTQQPGVLPPPTTQTVTDKMAYYGDEANNIFNIADVTVLSDANSVIYGGPGTDSLVLKGTGQTLDLTTMHNKLQSVEIIDITGTGNNTLKLSLDDVMRNGGTDLFHTSGKTQMMVKGNAGDVVDLFGLMSTEDPGSWAAQGTITTGGVVYQVYTHAVLGAELLVQQGVTTHLM